MVRHHRQGFTLLELLIVVAIVGILSSVAVPQFLQYQARAKIGTVNGNHKSVVSLISSEFSKCIAGATNSIMGSQVTACTSGVDDFADAVAAYMASESVTNPYNATVNAVLSSAAGTTEGTTYLTADTTNSLITITSIPETGQSKVAVVAKE